MFINRFIAIVLIIVSRNDNVGGNTGLLQTQINQFASPIMWNEKNWARGCEFNGNDLLNVTSESGNCGRLCIENANCTHYVWMDRNNGTCWMKGNGAVKADAVRSSDPSAHCGIISGGGHITWTEDDWAHRCEFFGNDLSNIPLIPDLCSDRCYDTLGCTHFVWTDHNNGTCFLKQYGATKLDAYQSSNPLAVCGTVKGGRNIAWNGNTWAVGCSFIGNNLTSFPSIREDCRSLCDYVTGCTHYTWTSYDKGTCFMKENGASKMDAFYISDPSTECGVVNSNYIAWSENKSADGCDFIGNDLRRQQSKREECRDLCISTRSCTHYTWTNYTDSNFDYADGTCWMKTLGARTSDAIRISDKLALCGIITDKNDYNFTWDENDSAEGCGFQVRSNDFRVARSPKYECRSLCEATPQCTHFVWGSYDNNGTCWLKKNEVTKSDAIPSPGMLCGVVVDSLNGHISWNENNSAVGCSFSGNSLTNVPSRAEFCADLCRLTAGCTHFSWLTATTTTDGEGICSMKKNGAIKAEAIPSLKLSTMCGIISSRVNRSKESTFGRIESDANLCDHCKEPCSTNVEGFSFTFGDGSGHKLGVKVGKTDRESHVSVKTSNLSLAYQTQLPAGSTIIAHTSTNDKTSNYLFQIQPCIKTITKPAINLVLLFEKIPVNFLNEEPINEFCNSTSDTANAESSRRCDGKLKMALREPNFIVIHGDLKDVEFQVVSHLPELDGAELIANECLISNNSRFLQNFHHLTINETDKHEWIDDIVHSVKYLHDSVTGLDLTSNGLKVLSAQLLVGFSHLEELKVSNNELETLLPETFKNQQKLQSLALDRNRLQHVTSDAFQGLSSLLFLDLSCNNLGIVEIEPNLFGSMETLTELNLSHNKLTSISGTLFGGLRNLKVVRINDNQLIAINSDAFTHTPNLEQIYLGANQLTFGDTHPQKLSLFRHLTELKQLHLQHNKITNILPDWRDIPQLRVLSLASNELTTLRYEDFNFTSSTPVVLNLEDNHISVNISDPTDDINSVIVVLNRIDCCNVNVSNFMAYVIKEDSSRIRFAIPNLHCSSAHSVTTRSIDKFNFRTMTCPVDECPANCRCMKKPFDNALIVNCSYANLTHPPDVAYSGNYSRVELLLDHNELLELPNVEQDLTITVIQASHNLLKTIHPRNLPRNLRVFNVSHNQIQRLDERVFKKLKNMDSLRHVALGKNSWRCDCSIEAETLVNFVKQKEKLISDLKEIKCPEQKVDVYGLNDQFIEDICLQRRNKILLSAFAVFIFVVAIISILYVKHQQTIKIWLYAHNICLCWLDEADLDKDKIYDAFVSYSHLDEDFAIGTIVARLENGTPSFKTCVHERDWLAGGFILESIAQSIANSRRTVIILSQNFLKSMWGRTEFQYAHDNAIAEKRVRVIIIIYGDIGSVDDLDPDLQSYLRTNTYVRWGDKWFWEKLRYALGHKT